MQFSYLWDSEKDTQEMPIREMQQDVRDWFSEYIMNGFV